MTLPVPQSPEPRGGRPPRHAADPQVHRITSAHSPLSEEQAFRQKRYLISMGIRTACFLGVIVTTGWLRWALLVAALVLPYIAVVMANAGRENDSFGVEPVPPVEHPQLQGPSQSDPEQ